MSQVKMYALKKLLDTRRNAMSDVVQACLVKTLALPPEKRFLRFFALEKEDFVFPQDRSENYTILEISMFAGRSTETKKSLIRELFARFEVELGIAPQDLEITIFETPKENWGIRGKPGDELALSYKVES